MFKDNVKATDEIEVGLVQAPIGRRVFKCPKCGSAMKIDQQEGWSICANKSCRERI